MELKIEASTDEAIVFENKRKMIFDCLNVASEKLVGTTLEQKSSPEKRHRTSFDQQDHRKEVQKFHGRESIFKRPTAPIAKCLKPRRAPDYQVREFYILECIRFPTLNVNLQINPHKWKKYTLSDADTSDKSNTAAAFAFLKEIEDRKSAANEFDCDDDNPSDKIVFNTRKRSRNANFSKSVHLKSAVNDESVDPVLDLPKMKGSKVLMPEYVIGQKKERKKSGGKSNKERADRKPADMLKLEHLFEEEDEEQ